MMPAVGAQVSPRSRLRKTAALYSTSALRRVASPVECAPMHPNATRVQASLAEHGSAGRIVELDALTGTAAEAAAALGCALDQIVKSLVFLAGDEPILILLDGTHRVSSTKVAAHLERPLRRADADAVREITGFPIGGTPPVAHRQPLRTLIDRQLLDRPTLWAAAGTPHAVFPTTPDELVRLTGGEVIDLAE
jgi:prolyl-tRNA editing enzyme YbaK/EbsC (Cys-tRNA(Pro) deacylase)